jgi:prepilin-type N-terminal cleavage/methylation domain-containing protein
MNGIKKMKAFTLVEIMIVVAILGLLIAIGVPGFLQARNKGRINTEKANLKAISDNIASYGVNERKMADSIVRLWPSTTSLASANSYIRRQLFCPTANSAYSIDPTQNLGSCASHGINPVESNMAS